MRTIEHLTRLWHVKVVGSNHIPFDERQDLLIELFEIIKAEGYQQTDIDYIDLENIKSRCYNKNHKDKSKLKIWKELVDHDIQWAITQVFEEYNSTYTKSIDDEEIVDKQPIKLLEIDKNLDEPTLEENLDRDLLNELGINPDDFLGDEK